VYLSHWSAMLRVEHTHERVRLFKVSVLKINTDSFKVVKNWRIFRKDKYPVNNMLPLLPLRVCLL
jgi:hypothetical protein